jgi:hypothetical protein
MHSMSPIASVIQKILGHGHALSVLTTLHRFVITAGNAPYAPLVLGIEFLGQGFISGKTAVSFNGTAAKPTVVSSTYLTVAVPKGATTGLITVTTSGINLTSNRTFRLIS